MKATRIRHLTILTMVALMTGGCSDSGAPTSTGERREPQEVVAIQPTPTPTTSIEPAPRSDDVVIPPDRFQPSAPVVGQVIVDFYSEEGGQGHDVQARSVHIYADGRVISGNVPCEVPHPDCDLQQVLPDHPSLPNTGLVEQRLAPEGVEMLRSEVLQSIPFGQNGSFLDTTDLDLADYLIINARKADGRLRRFDAQPGTWGSVRPTPQEARLVEHVQRVFMDLDAWLPVSAWEGKEIRAFIPSTYGCWVKLDKRLLSEIPRGIFPGSVDALLAAAGCGNITLEEARVIADGFAAAGVPSAGSLEYSVTTDAGRLTLYLEPNLPGYPSY